MDIAWLRKLFGHDLIDVRLDRFLELLNSFCQVDGEEVSGGLDVISPNKSFFLVEDRDCKAGQLVLRRDRRLKHFFKCPSEE